MKTPRRSLLVLAALVTATHFAAAATIAATTPPTDLEGARLDTGLQRRLEAIAKAAPGACGISVVNLGTGRFAGVAAHESFPMASTYKLPIALAVLRMVDRGEAKLEERVRLLPADMNPEVSVLTERFPQGGADISIHRLLDGMLRISDNTACDVLIRRAGGPAAITREIEAAGITGLRIDRTESEAGNDWIGLRVKRDSSMTAARLREARKAVRPRLRAHAARTFSSDPRDTSTPLAMTRLLERLWRGQVLSPALTDTLEAMLFRCVTGTNRLRAGVPAGIKLAHRTGTGGTWDAHTFAVNDVGTIVLPGGGGTVVVAVFLRDVRGTVQTAERTIADVARAVVDAWNAPE